MTIPIVTLLITQLLVPALLILWLWKTDFSSKIAWLISTLGFGAFVGFYLLTGRWDWIGYPLRVLLPAALLVAAYVSLCRLRTKDAAWWRRPSSFGGWSNLVASALLVVLFGLSTVQAVQGLSPGRARAVELSFPLEGGVSYVAHGGDTVALNYHNVEPPQSYAVDVVQLTPLGTRAWGLYPAELDRYAIFGETVVSPCSGEVLTAEDSREDHRPPGSDPDNPPGNHVVVRCETVEGAPAADVVLAHLQQGSVVVEEADEVEEGQPLGSIGNSGNTTEPHLHIHAVRTGSGSILDGEGVPIRFDGRFVVRNSLVF